MTFRNSARLFHHVLFNMGDLHVVLPALNLSNMNAGILIMMQQVRLMVVVVAHKILVSAQGPFWVFGFGA